MTRDYNDNRFNVPDLLQAVPKVHDIMALKTAAYEELCYICARPCNTPMITSYVLNASHVLNAKTTI